MDPRHSGPVGGGCMTSDVGHRKYVLVKDMVSRFRFRYRMPLYNRAKWSKERKKSCVERGSVSIGMARCEGRFVLVLLITIVPVFNRCQWIP